MNNTLKLLTLATLVLAAACAGDETRPDDQGTGTAGSGTGGPMSTGGGIVGGSSGRETSGGATGSMPSSNVLYFEFDSSELRPEGARLAEAWARYLAANPGAKVRLEGHTDERGTREYNVGLGERRGNSVLTALTSRGVSERQLTVSSFGEERPVATGHDEAAWGQNRRVEIVR